MYFLRVINSLVLLFLCNVTHAQNSEQTVLIREEKTATSPWYFDTGIRYWLGQSDFEFNLYNIKGDQLLSRLTYQDVTTDTAEGFWRLGHQDGVFFKGYIGAGSNIGGAFIDEDFPSAFDVYSRTQSDQKHGRLNYFSADLGYDLFQYSRYKISPFIGYHYWLTHYNSFGCSQTADNPDICSSYTFSSAANILNNDATWNSLRLGVNGEMKLLENVNFVFDAAYIHAYLLGHDFHNLRSDIRGEFFDGIGDGFQLDMALNWHATPNLSFGLGARWWEVNTDGYVHFEELAAEGRPQHVDVTQKNYGLMVQSQYQFDDGQQHVKSIDKDGLNQGVEHWDGLFVGANVGYGMSPNNASVLPFESTPLDFSFFSPLLIHLQSSGFLGGAQVGYNWTKNNVFLGHVLLGIESDFDYAAVGGSNSITFTPTPYLLNNSVGQQLNWFGTVRGRLGKVVSNTLLPYVTAGFSFANTELTYAQTVLFYDEPVLEGTYSSTQTISNWVAGAGLEYAVSDHLRYKLEYLYLDSGDLGLDSTYYAIDSNFTSNILRLGINYHF